ncbi:MAG: sigma-54-dependent Fis family transcriptional regulator [Deltaproteobacteria bacterium]|nr:sigma-54-dependent Fis family transcriptional regulator [Deltaproteobacteria bacterium]
MSKLPTVLVIDDDAGVVSWLVDSLPEEGFEATGETSARQALALLEERGFDLVVSDVEMPEMRGLELLRAILRVRPQQPVLLITAFGSIDLAMEAVRAGAADFLAKPFRIEALSLSLRRALRERQLRREIRRLREATLQEAPSGLVARSACMKSALDLAYRAARSHLPVLLTGESGVGKGALARLIHESSARRAERFVQLNCAALPAGLAEAELFGVKRGAFTDAREDRPGVFAQAHGGTLFLDEVGDLPLELQPKLLQALESNRVRPLGASEDAPADVRVVAATNRPLEEDLRARRFRPDLYHRLNVIRVEVPPLRERPEDIEPIVDQVLHELARRSERVAIGLSTEALRKLKLHSWPGNVRELVNTVERAVALSNEDVLSAEDVSLQRSAEAGTLLSAALDRDLSLQELEREYIRHVLLKTGGHKGRAAKILGLDRRTLYKKVAELEEF